MAEFKSGDDVTWKSHGGTADGTIVKKQTNATTIGGHKVVASTEDPQFIVETDEGKKAAHKPGALKRKD